MAHPQVVMGFYNVYLDTARHFVQEAGKNAKHSAGYSAAAIALACAAAEVRLNEYLFDAIFSGSIPWDDVCELQESRESFYERYKRVVRTISDGKEKLGDRDEYKDFVLAVMLRNHLVHYTPAFRVQGVWPKKLGSFPRDILTHDPKEHDWSSVLLTVEVAKWVVEQCEQFVATFDNLLGQYDPKNAAQFRAVSPGAKKEASQPGIRQDSRGKPRR